VTYADDSVFEPRIELPRASRLTAPRSNQPAHYADLNEHAMFIAPKAIQRNRRPLRGAFRHQAPRFLIGCKEALEHFPI